MRSLYHKPSAVAPCLENSPRSTPGLFAHRCPIQVGRLTPGRAGSLQGQQRFPYVLRTISPPKETVHQDVQQSQPETEQGGYDWFRAWYPLTPVEYLDPKKPQGIQLLGKKLVLWKDETGNWSCLEDVCPHRAARLSEGRIEPKTGGLMCSYHGWQFNGSGGCISIPQAETPEDEKRMCSKPNACAKRYPVREEIGLLWVWPESGPTASLEAATKSLNIPKGWDTEPDQWLPLKHWFMRDVPYSWDTLIENVVDPSHVSYAHHGVQGNREKPNIWPMSARRKTTLNEGFIMEASTSYVVALDDKRFKDEDSKKGYAERFGQNRQADPDKGPPGHVIHFKPPDFTLYEIAGGMINMVNYAVPTSPGTARILHKVMGNKRMLPKKIQKIAGFKPPLVVCKDHMENHAVLDGDGIFLHYQERDLAENDKSWRQLYYMPTSMDKAVVAFRHWWEMAGAHIPWVKGAEPGLSPRPTREEMLDRWHSHTKFCPTCQKGLATLRMVQSVLAVLGAAALLTSAAYSGAAIVKAAIVGSSRVPIWKIVATGFVGALLVGASAWMQQLKSYFYFRDYVHAER